MSEQIQPLENFFGPGMRAALSIVHTSPANPVLFPLEMPIIFQAPSTHIIGLVRTGAPSTGSQIIHSYITAESSAAADPTLYTGTDFLTAGALVAQFNIPERPNVANVISGFGVSNSTTLANISSTTNTTVKRQCIGVNSSGNILAVSCDGSAVSVIDTGLVMSTSGAFFQVYMQIGSGAFRIIVSDNSTGMAYTPAEGGLTSFGKVASDVGAVHLFKAATAGSSNLYFRGGYYLAW